MTDRIFLRLGPKLALGADEHQWIVYKGFASKTRTNGQWQGLTWTPAEIYVRTTRALLVERIREKELDASTAGMAALAGLPLTFAEWQAAQAPAASAAMAPPTTAAEPPTPPKGRARRGRRSLKARMRRQAA
jgi:hypothetical protein